MCALHSSAQQQAKETNDNDDIIQPKEKGGGNGCPSQQVVLGKAGIGVQRAATLHRLRRETCWGESRLPELDTTAVDNSSSGHNTRGDWRSSAAFSLYISGS